MISIVEGVESLVSGDVTLVLLTEAVVGDIESCDNLIVKLSSIFIPLECVCVLLLLLLICLVLVSKKAELVLLLAAHTLTSLIILKVEITLAKTGRSRITSIEIIILLAEAAGCIDIASLGIAEIETFESCILLTAK